MHYNLKVEMERRNGVINSQIEISGVGRAGRKVFTAPTFKDALVQLQKEHDALLGQVEAFHKPPEAAPVQEPALAKPASAKKPSKKAPAKKKAEAKA